jgi:hypothetical protein
MKYVFAFIFSSVSLFATEKDSIYCFNKKDITLLANKIQMIRDSVDYLKTVVDAQDTVIDLYQSRSDMFLKQLNNRDQIIDACQKRSKELEKINEELQPRWYDNKFLWFLTGAASVVGIILVVQ